MGPVFVLLVLVFVSYAGGLLVARPGAADSAADGDGAKPLGSVSGLEWLLAGVVCGPLGLGWVSRTALQEAEPLLAMGIGWIGFVDGLRWGRSQRKFARISRVLLAAATGALVAAGTGWAAFTALPYVAPGALPYRIPVAVTLGACAAETARSAVRWLRAHAGARGPLTAHLSEMASAEDLVPVALLAYACAFHGSGEASLFESGDLARRAARELSNHYRALFTVGLGTSMGAITALFLRRELRVRETWGVLLGATLFAAGLSERLNLSEFAVTFLMGIAAAAFLPDGGPLRATVAPTYRPVLLPVFLMGGALISIDRPRWMALLAALVIGTRAIGHVVAAVLASVGVRSLRTPPSLVAVGLSGTSSFSICIALAFALHFPERAWMPVLVCAVATAAVTQIFAAPSLKRALSAAGELGATG